MGQTVEPPKRVHSRSTFWDILFGDGAPLGPRRRSLALVVVLGGIITFFVPLVSTDPPVVETTDWSPFNVVRQMYLGKLPQPTCERCGEPIIRSFLALPTDVTVVYVLMLVALIAICFQSSAALARIGLIGILASLDTYQFRGGTNFVTRWDFESTFYGSLQQAVAPYGRVYDGWLTTALFAIMGSLALIAARENFEAEPCLGRRTLTGK